MDLDGGLGVRIFEKPILTFDGQHRESRDHLRAHLGLKQWRPFRGIDVCNPKFHILSIPNPSCNPHKMGLEYDFGTMKFDPILYYVPF